MDMFDKMLLSEEGEEGGGGS